MKWNVLNRRPKVPSTAIEEMRIEVEELAKSWDGMKSVKHTNDMEPKEVML